MKRRTEMKRKRRRLAAQLAPASAAVATVAPRKKRARTKRGARK